MKSLLIPTALLLLSVSACSYNPAADSAPASVPKFGQPLPVSLEESNSAEPAIAASPDGSVYVVWVDHQDGDGDINLAQFNPNGEKRGATVRVNRESDVATGWRGDPPMIAIAPDKSVLVSWTAKVKSERGHSTDLFLSLSRDQGRTFSDPVKVNDDDKPAVHGMHSLAVDHDGRIYVAWLDERNTLPVPAQDSKMKKGTSGHHMESNREVFIASSTDNGRTFTANKLVATDACPCCKTALAIGPDNRVYLSWRQVLPGNFRHIAVTSSVDHGNSFAEPKIVSDDQWMLAGCPVSGSAMAVSADGILKVMWYSAGRNGEKGLYSSESSDGGKSFGPRRMVAAGDVRGTPALASTGKLSIAVTENLAGKVAGVYVDGVGAGLTSVSGSVPAATFSGRHLVTAYVAEANQKRRIWLVFDSIARTDKGQ